MNKYSQFCVKSAITKFKEIFQAMHFDPYFLMTVPLKVTAISTIILQLEHLVHVRNQDGHSFTILLFLDVHLKNREKVNSYAPCMST
jgi:hypothetical protein